MLDPARASKLVYVYSNMCVLQNVQGEQLAGKPVSLLDPADMARGDTPPSPDVSLTDSADEPEEQPGDESDSGDHSGDGVVGNS